MLTKDGSNETDQSQKRGWLSYWALLFLQTQNAFNDKAAQFLLIPLGLWLANKGSQVVGVDKIEYILSAVIVLPFILFSPISGWVSDRFSKTYVVRATAILQLVILLWIAVSIHYHQLWVAIGAFFVLSIQSVLLGPAKRGIVKELVGSKKLGFASGLMEITAVLAICLGQIVTNIWYGIRVDDSKDGWNAALFPLIVLSCASVVTLMVSMIIHPVPAGNKRPFKPSILFEHFGQLGELWKVRPLKLASVGVAFFWGYATYINLAAIKIAKDSTDNVPDFTTESAWLMSAASLGIILGGAIASRVCKNKIELGLVPLGGIIMILGTMGMAFSCSDLNWLKLWLVIGGAGAAILLIPLNAFIQDECPPEKRGKVLAGVGLFDCLVGLFAVAIQSLLVVLKVSFFWQFIGLAIICFFAARYAARLLPQDFVRLVVLGGFKIFYRVKVMNAERIPKEGGVLLTPNHVTYIDAFILSVACPRKIRFLMFDGYFKRRWIGDFVRLFDAVPISQTRAKDALRVAAEALEEGAVVCIFPEGQLARTGAMNEFKRGFEMIARKAKCPVLPAAMDGLWGSIFSFERNKFIYKIPYRCPFPVMVNFGETIEPRDAKAEKVSDIVGNLRAEAFALRPIFGKPQELFAKDVKVIGDGIDLYDARKSEILGLNHEEKIQLVANAVQVGEVNALRRGQTVMMDWSGLGESRDVLAIVFAQYYNLKVILMNDLTPCSRVLELSKEYHVDQYLGGAHLAEILSELKIDKPCYDFSENALSRKSKLPCLSSGGKVIAMSMPHPEAETATNQHQSGYLENSWGRLLPGFKTERRDDGVAITGISLDENGLFSKNLHLDENGMLCIKSETDASAGR